MAAGVDTVPYLERGQGWWLAKGLSGQQLQLWRRWHAQNLVKARSSSSGSGCGSGFNATAVIVVAAGDRSSYCRPWRKVVTLTKHQEVLYGVFSFFFLLSLSLLLGRRMIHNGRC